MRSRLFMAGTAILMLVVLEAVSPTPWATAFVTGSSSELSNLENGRDRVSPRLAALSSASNEHARGLVARKEGIELTDGFVTVVFKTSRDKAQNQATIARGAGARTVRVVGDFVLAEIPPSAILQISTHVDVQWMDVSTPAIRSSANYLDKAGLLARIGADQWHSSGAKGKEFV
jgi:hypothetical protein